MPRFQRNANRFHQRGCAWVAFSGVAKVLVAVLCSPLRLINWIESMLTGVADYCFPWRRALAGTKEETSAFSVILATARAFLAIWLFTVSGSAVGWHIPWLFLFEMHGWPERYVDFYRVVNVASGILLLFGLFPRLTSSCLIVAWLILPKDWHWLLSGKSEGEFMQTLAAGLTVPIASLIAVFGAGKFSLNQLIAQSQERLEAAHRTKTSESLPMGFSIFLSVLGVVVLAFYFFCHFQSAHIQADVGKKMLNNFFSRWYERKFHDSWPEDKKVW